MFRKICLSLILLLSVHSIFPQTVEKDKKDEISPEMKKEAVAFLRETALEVNSLRSLENRISFSSEMASLMWFSDEKEARAMFQNVINDFRELLNNYQAQLNQSGAATENVGNYSPFSGSGNQAERKFTAALGVRRQIAQAIAEHDAELAMQFFSDTGAAITNQKFRKQIENSDVYFETQLLSRIAEQNVETALKFGRKTLAKGFNYQMINLLQKIYAKDPEKGAEFGEEIISKLKSDMSKPDTLYNLSRILNVGVENLNSIKGKPDKKPLFSEQSLRDLADLEAQEIMKRPNGTDSYEISSYLADIERFQPSRAVQIRQKFGIKQNGGNSSDKVAVVGNEVSIASGKSNQDGAPNSPEAENQAAQNQLNENIKNLGSQKLSDEERKKFVEQSRKIIAGSNNREQKMFGLTALAIQVAKLGDKDLALDLMNEVQNSVNLQPKNYREFMEVWLLAGSYSQIDAGKAFPILEDSIFRLNDTIGAFIKVGEFMDVSGEIIDDGEVQVGSFGGEITRGLLGSLGASDTTIKNLAVADFTRTKNLTNKFDRTEVRILAKMLVLRSIFAKESKPSPEGEF